jgi:hypothetical protein
MPHKATWKLPKYENTEEYWKLHKQWRDDYNTCADCGSKDFRLKNFDRMMRDGDIYCNVCGAYVRMFDAG